MQTMNQCCYNLLTPTLAVTTNLPTNRGNRYTVLMLAQDFTANIGPTFKNWQANTDPMFGNLKNFGYMQAYLGYDVISINGSDMLNSTPIPSLQTAFQYLQSFSRLKPTYFLVDFSFITSRKFAVNNACIFLFVCETFVR